MTTLLSLVATPVPVIVRSMTPEVIKSLPPEVIKSLPPVDVHSMPPPDSWTAIGIGAAVVAAVFAIIAVIVAVVTVRKINEQLKRADEQLDLARRELKLVEADLAYSRQQADYISRRAKLRLFHNRQRIESLYMQTEQTEELQCEIRLWLFNDGNNTARDASIFLWLPKGWKVPGWDGIHNPEGYFAQQGLKAIANVPVGSDRYWHVVADVPFPTYPGVERLALSFQAVVRVGFDGQVLWRVGFDDGIEPPYSEPEGRLHFVVQKKTVI